LGSTHQAIEDIAILRALPNMMVLCPSDGVETKELMLQSYKIKKPAYIRLMRKSSVLHKIKTKVQLGKSSVLKKGNDGAIIASGLQVSFCLEIVEELKKIGKRFKLINLHTLKPIDKKSLLKQIKGIKKVLAVEEHSVIGGLGGAISEILAESDWRGQFKIIGIPDTGVQSTVSVLMHVPSRKVKWKDIVKVEDRELDKSQVDRIALIAPNATINIIRNYNVVEKHIVEPPKEVVGLVRCENPNCITNKPREPVKSKFTVASHEPLQLRCAYCERITTDIAKHLL
jgi:aspartate carbamoyltransferase regulatory subunit